MIKVLIFFLISFVASSCGAICGIGGGVITKPLLDALSLGSVEQINFLSACSVLSMSLYSVVKSFFGAENRINMSETTPLAIGAAIGGVVGKLIFTTLSRTLFNPSVVGAVQSGCLLLVTAFTLVYTVNREKLRTIKITHPLPVVFVGMALGVISSFLGIGGGPLNLVFLYLFLGMETKQAAINSLYIILFSQTASIALSIVSSAVPQVNLMTLIVMVLGGVIGGIAGRATNRHLSGVVVRNLFVAMMVVIALLSVYNTIKYLYSVSAA